MKLGRIERALMGVCCHCRHCLESGCSRIFNGSSEKSQVQIEAKKTDISSYEYVKCIY